jgi:hypothetical protein
MKKTLLILLILFSNFAFAQFDLKNPTAFTLNAGFFLPYSSEVFKSGASFGIDVQHKLDPIHIYLSLVHNSSSRKNNEPNEFYENTSGTSITEFTGGARMYMGNYDIKYFLDFGIGFYFESKGSYNIKQNGITTINSSEKNTTFGGNFGVGAEYPLNNDFDLVGKLKYHLYFGVGNDPFINPYFALTAGIKYNIKL